MLLQQSRLPRRIEQAVARLLPPLPDAREDRVGQRLVLDQTAIAFGDPHVGFGDHLFHIAQSRGEERPGLRHLA
jgi:hypothetical protein